MQDLKEAPHPQSELEQNAAANHTNAVANVAESITQDFRDDEDHIRPEFIALIRDTLEGKQADRLIELAGDLHEADLGALLEELAPDERMQLINLMGKDFDFTALTEVDDHIREEILEDIPNAAIAEGMRDLDSDDAIYILEDLPEEDQEEVLASMPQSERATLERGLDYPDDSAGRKMQSDYIAVPPFWTVGQTIDYMRDHQDLPEQFYSLFVVDKDNHVTGLVALSKLLRTRRPERIDAIMEETPHIAHVLDDQEDVADLFKRYNLVSMPVVDEAGRLAGVLTFDDMTDVIEQEADEDILALAGVKADEELGDSVWSITKGRFTWLLINLMTAFLASTVLKGFQNELEKMVALAILAPIVASQGGNAGTQTMTVIVRALATRELSSSNAFKVISREVMVGMMNGLGFAFITGLITFVWFKSFDLGIVIGISMIVVLIAAAIAGVIIPLILDRYDIDPAVSSGPFVTTVTDIVAFFAFLGTATLWFGFS